MDDFDEEMFDEWYWNEVDKDMQDKVMGYSFLDGHNNWQEL